MRKIIMLICLGLWTVLAVAQEGPSRDPAGASRAPAGEKSGREVGDPGGRGGEKEKSVKTTVSKEAKSTSKDIKAANSLDGKGKTMTETQRNEAERQLGNEQARAAAENRRADAKFFEKEKDKLNKNK